MEKKIKEIQELIKELEERGGQFINYKNNWVGIKELTEMLKELQVSG